MGELKINILASGKQKKREFRFPTHVKAETSRSHQPQQNVRLADEI